MTHYREFFDNNNLGVWDLGDEDCVVTIKTVRPGEVGGQQGRKKSRKPILTFAEFGVPMVCNVTNAKTIASLHGTDPHAWVGKRIVLYATTTNGVNGEVVDCIRVRPTVPRGEGKPRERKPLDTDVRERQQRAAGEQPHPAAAIKEAANAGELRTAIRKCAGWIEAKDREKRWEWVVQRCAEVGLDVVEAERAASEGLEGGGDGD